MLILLILISLVIAYLALSVESFTEPWNREKCKINCFQRGQNIPWIGKIDGAWNDPAAQSEAVFDVAGCMERCDNPY